MKNVLTNERKKELLDLVLQQVKFNSMCRGICYAIESGLFGCYSVEDWERWGLKEWFLTQKPTDELHSEFTNVETHYTGGDWWWARTEIGKETRIKFLVYLISKL